MTTARLVSLDRWIDEIQVRIVDDLPQRCGGAVGYMDDDGTRWVLLDPSLPWRHPTFDPDDMAEWSAAFIEEWGYVSAQTLADQRGVPLEEALGAVWLSCVVWWDHLVDLTAS